MCAFQQKSFSPDGTNSHGRLMTSHAFTVLALKQNSATAWMTSMGYHVQDVEMNVGKGRDEFKTTKVESRSALSQTHV